jgi:hypothetical protein
VWSLVVRRCDVKLTRLVRNLRLLLLQRILEASMLDFLSQLLELLNSKIIEVFVDQVQLLLNDTVLLAARLIIRIGST